VMRPVSLPSSRPCIHATALAWDPAPSPPAGNLTNGGTGKTPFVEYLARHYVQAHRMPTMVLQVGLAFGWAAGWACGRVGPWQT